MVFNVVFNNFSMKSRRKSGLLWNRGEKFTEKEGKQNLPSEGEEGGLIEKWDLRAFTVLHWNEIWQIIS